MDRLVHLDLKGAPPSMKSSFWNEFCTWLVEKGRVTGLLIEFEDVLPIKLLEDLDSALPKKRRHVYSPQEAHILISVAQARGLKIIPLVQTFGHLEYLLKYNQLKSLREHPDYPDSICPAETSESPSFSIVTQLIDQMMTFLRDFCHAGGDAIHLGGDEVWQLGQGSRSRERLLAGETRLDLYIRHIELITSHIKTKYPGMRTLLWDDMLRAISPAEQQRISPLLRDSLELVVWQYSPNPAEHLPQDLFSRYSSNYNRPPWAATAFKGASSSCALLPDIANRISNHIGWTNISSQNRFTGVVLTGWQRFDHYASLCELMPVSIPSLRCCLAALDSPDIRHCPQGMIGILFNVNIFSHLIVPIDNFLDQASLNY